MTNIETNIEHANIDSSACTEHLAKVREFADKIGLREQFESQLTRLAGTYFGRESRVRLLKDFAPYSFEFVKVVRNDSGGWDYAVNGGVIYHGPHDNGGDGSGPTFSVKLEPHTGWSTHT